MNLTPKQIAEQIFSDIDKAIASSIKKVPVPFDNSDFLKKYKEIKEKFLK